MNRIWTNDALFSLRSAMIVCALLLIIPFLYTASGDNTLYMYMAELLTKGRLPYLGSWDHNYPGIVFIHLLHVIPFGASMIGFHLFDGLCQLLLAYLVYRVTFVLTNSERAAWFASVAIILYYVGSGPALYAERDCFITLLLVASMWLLVRPKPSHLASALVIGSAIVLRPTAAAYCAALALWVGVIAQDKRFLATIRYGALTLLPIGLFALWYVLIGGIDEFLEATYTYNLEVYARPGLALADLIPPVVHWPLLTAIPVGLWSLFRSNRRYFYAMTLLIAAAFVSLIPVYRFSYHYHPLISLCLIISMIGWDTVLNWILSAVGSVRVRRPLTIALSVLLIGVVADHFISVKRLTRLVGVWWNADHDKLTHVYDYYHPDGEWGMAVEDSLVEFLKSNCHEEDRVQSLTTTMYVPLKAGVQPASRFTNIFNLCIGSSGRAGVTPMQQEWRQEYISDIKRARPKYLIGSAHFPDHVFNNGYMPWNIMDGFAELKQVIATDFDSVRRIGGYTIYQIKTKEGA